MDCTIKERMVDVRHITDPSVSIKYSSVVSRYSMKISFVIVDLNVLDILAIDIGNAYLNATCC